MLKNIEVDVLGRWEAGPGMETPNHVMRSLLRHGVVQEWFVPEAVMFQQDEEIILYDPTEEKSITSIFIRDIRDPVAYVRKGSPNGFSSVVVFRIAGSGHFNFNSIFIAIQCLNDEPQDVVERLIELCGLEKGGRQRRMSDVSVSSFASVHRRSASAVSNYSQPEAEQRKPPLPIKSPTISQNLARTESFGLDRPSFLYDHSDDPVQKDTILLNYCTDDIEKLCRELRNSRDDVPGARVIDSFRATEFTSVFQKIKLAFNLLGRLNPHLKDPNASDIVYFLFPPLAFLMDAGNDLFDDDLQKDVISPLLTSTAVSFLRQCLNSRQRSIWEACGPAWTTPRNEYDGSTVPYRPLFSDGWSPGYIDFQEDDVDGKSRSISRSQPSVVRSPTNGIRSPSSPPPYTDRRMDQGYRIEDKGYRREDKGYRTEENSFRTSADSNRNRNNSEMVGSDYGSDASSGRFQEFDEEEKEDFESFRDKLLERDALIALVLHPWNGHNSKELNVRKGEYLEVLNNDKKWWRCRDSSNKIGYVPYTLLTTLVSAEKIWEKEMQEKKEKKEKKEKAEREKEERRSRDQREKLEKIGRRIPSRSPSSSPDRSPRGRSPSPAPSMPPPPPPLPARQPSIRPIEIKQRKPQRSNSIQSTFSMQDELKHVLSFYSEEKIKPLDIYVTPDIFVDQRSTSREVRNWLIGKGFSEKVQSQLGNMSGKQILAIQRKDLEILFGKEEGGRLDSQITLSRNQTKYTQVDNKFRGFFKILFSYFNFFVNMSRH
ncbi:epidermal growth factor receptor kinase substrate 8 isoform X1 [Eurytemora carolleeae]|uniref:epidermal growth factor receptor kinase substrate 8 isoform X1 n=1 Tax=Eurytemora carolleeae TaxID=1294199 RepID=UPI000C76FE3E|nr:epidermal growth factor receptor kinase substrate 8 isoform X1 [Eurytemora carolleeae]|eukprot:XP_023339867.1 epidermal growth factor receptor kinase substrate 8-like isoform X1 [Eurytemora affinis]